MVTKEQISSVKLFKGLRETEVKAIARLCEVATFEDGERILKEGGRGENFFILESGSVDLRFELPYRESTKEMTVASVPLGGCFGWSSVVEPFKTTLSCYSAGPSKVIRLQGAALLDLCEENPHIGFVFMKNLAALIGDRLTHQREVFIREAGDSLQFGW